MARAIARAVHFQAIRRAGDELEVLKHMTYSRARMIADGS